MKFTLSNLTTPAPGDLHAEIDISGLHPGHEQAALTLFNLLNAALADGKVTLWEVFSILSMLGAMLGGQGQG